MNMLKKMTSLTVSVLTLVLVSTSVFAAGISVGVMAPRGKVEALKQWGDLGKFLEKEIGQPVEIVALKPADTLEMFSTGQVQFTLSNPVLAVELKAKANATPLASMVKNSGKEFGGVIISKKGSNINSAADLKGKKVLAFQFKKSAAAYVFQVKHLKDQGVDAEKDFASFKEAKNQDDIVLAVQRGIADAGFVKTGLLESMAKEGKISMDDFTIVDQKADGFAHVHSTELYPEWMMMATPNVDSALAAKVKTALLKLAPTDDASKSGKISGFSEPLSLDSLEATLKELKLAPYDK